MNPRFLRTAAAFITPIVVVSAFLTCGPPAHWFERDYPPPEKRTGVLAAPVESVLARHRGVACLRDRAPAAVGTGWFGCRLQAGDTAFYFYVDPTGLVTSWQRMWKAPTPDPMLTATMLDSLLSTHLGDAQICAADARLGYFRVWRQPSYYVALFADRDAATLQIPEDIHLWARLGTPTCTARDLVSAPLRR